jgi:hypothetical protein
MSCHLLLMYLGWVLSQPGCSIRGGGLRLGMQNTWWKTQIEAYAYIKPGLLGSFCSWDRCNSLCLSGAAVAGKGNGSTCICKASKLTVCTVQLIN